MRLIALSCLLRQRSLGWLMLKFIFGWDTSWGKSALRFLWDYVKELKLCYIFIQFSCCVLLKCLKFEPGKLWGFSWLPGLLPLCLFFKIRLLWRFIESRWCGDITYLLRTNLLVFFRAFYKHDRDISSSFAAPYKVVCCSSLPCLLWGLVMIWWNELCRFDILLISASSPLLSTE